MLELSIWLKPPRGAFQRAGRLLWGEICRNKAKRMVRVRSETPATPSPDTGGAEASEPPASIIVNNYYCVSDSSRLVAEREEFITRQRARRPGAGVSGGYSSPAGIDKVTRATKNWALLAQSVLFRNVQRWRCRELQKLWESCMKLKRRLETHPWEVARNSDWAKAEGFKGSQPKHRLPQKPSRAKGHKSADSSDEDPVKMIR